MVTGSNLVKIMDFGLAKLSDQTMITKLGSPMGTIGYMSLSKPRRRSRCADRPLALGVVLYEMLTGKMPFDAGYDQAVIYAILNEEPKPVSSIIKDVSKEVDQVIKILLSKRPENRYQTADDLLIDLKAIKQSIETGIPVNLIKSNVSVSEYITQTKKQLKLRVPQKEKT